MTLRYALLLPLLLALAPAQEPTGDLARKLAGVTFEQHAEGPGYSEGPTWRNGEVFFCSGSLLRVDAKRQVHRYLDINPAGTVLLANGHLLVADNKSRAILDVAPEGTVNVVADQYEGFPLRGLNDLTLDARGNVYWSDPEGSSLKTPVGNVYRLRPDGRVDRVAAGLAFPNGLDVDPASKYLYVIESQSKKILRYALRSDDQLLGKPEVFYDLGGSGGDGCAFDVAGNLWVADFHRPETGKGRITVLSPEAKVLAYLNVPAKVVSNIAFGGPNRDEIYCTTGEPPGVFRAKVGVVGFAGHPGKALPVVRPLNVVARRPHADAALLAKLVQTPTREMVAMLTDAQVRKDAEALLPAWGEANQRHQRDVALLAEVKRLGGKATSEVHAPTWLRSIVGDEGLQPLSRIVELELNERTDGHKEPTPKKLEDRVTDDWLKRLAEQTDLRRLELSGTAVTSAGLVHLKHLTQIERLNVCLTAVSDAGFEHLAGLTKLRRIAVCSSKVTGSGFAHLSGAKHLESINLHSSPASDAGLAAIGKLASLTRLEIVHTNVSDAGLAHLAGLVRLQRLHIHGPTTTEAALPFLGKLTDLYQLDIYDRAASNATLAEVAKLPRLRQLMLVQGVFDDAGVAQLAKVSSLEELTLDSAKVTDASIDTLASLKHLRKLTLSRTAITAAGRARLKAALPELDLGP